jgi:hypothetical protein
VTSGGKLDSSLVTRHASLAMADRDNHYEAAFEAYLRRRGVPYVAVDEGKRALLGGESIKNLDFIVSCESGSRWLVDVKGRLFPSGEGKQYWKNWSTQDDLRSLAQWERLFGTGFAALFVFAYLVAGERAPLPADRLFPFRNRVYGFIGIRLQQYIEAARMISPAWDTVAMPVSGFRRLAQPIDELF